MTCWSDQVQANSPCMIDKQSRELYCSDFIMNMFKIGLHLDGYELTSFIFGIMIDVTKVYISVPGWMTLTFIQGHRVARNLKHVHSFCWTEAWSTPNFCGGWFCNEWLHRNLVSTADMDRLSICFSCVTFGTEVIYYLCGTSGVDGGEWGRWQDEGGARSVQTTADTEAGLHCHRSHHVRWD